jgi:hypothetical protein
VFDVTTSVSSSSKVTTSFPVDAALVTPRDGGRTFSNSLIPRLTSPKFLLTHSTDAEQTVADSSVDLDYNDGFLTGSSGHFDVSSAAMWRRAPNFFDVVAYTGNGSSTRNLSHSLGVAPEMVIWKSRSSGNWLVWHSFGPPAVGGDNYIELNNDGDSKLATWLSISGDNFIVAGTVQNSAYSMNNSGVNYIAYLFASLDGVSKVGSFTHTSGTDTNVDCGFTAGARFVLIKRTDSAGSWSVMDTERGIVVGNDPRLTLDTTNAETTSLDFIDPLSSGFTVTGSGTYPSGDYIFYAIA